MALLFMGGFHFLLRRLQGGKLHNQTDNKRGATVAGERGEGEASQRRGVSDERVVSGAGVGIALLRLLYVIARATQSAQIDRRTQDGASAL